MLTYVLTTIVVLGGLYLIYCLLLRGEKLFRFNRFFMLLCLLVALLAPLDLFFFDALPAVMPQSFSLPEFSTIEGVSVAENGQEMTTHHVYTVTSGMSLKLLLQIIYSLVTIVLVVRLLRNLYRIRRSIKRRGYRLHEGVRLVPLESGAAPYSFFSYVFLDQTSINSDVTRSVVFQHEKAHAAQLHSIDVLLIEILACFLWINPFVWLFKRAIKENHEFLADSAVIRHGVMVENYASCLVQAVGNTNAAHLTSGFYINQTKFRIMLLYKSKRSKFFYSLKTIMAIGLLAVVLLFSAFSSSKNDAPFVVVIDVGHVGKDPGGLAETNEKVIALAVAKRLKALSDADQQVIIKLTRTTDEFMTLADRVTRAENYQADLFLSLHCSYDLEATTDNAIAYYCAENDYTEQSQATGLMLIKNYVGKYAEKGQLGVANFYVLKHFDGPGVLFELGNLGDSQEAQRLSSPEKQHEIAATIYHSLVALKNSRLLFSH